MESAFTLQGAKQHLNVNCLKGIAYSVACGSFDEFDGFGRPGPIGRPSEGALSMASSLIY